MRIDSQSVTPSFFQVLRASPMLGRAFTEDEAVFKKDQFAILSYGLWRDLFGKDPNAIGKDIRLSGVPYKIVGVMPRGFESPGSLARVWVPLGLPPQMTTDDARHNNNWGMMAQLKPGITLAYARQRSVPLNKHLLDRFLLLRPFVTSSPYTPVVAGMKDEMVQDVKPTLYLLQAAVI